MIKKLMTINSSFRSVVLVLGIVIVIFMVVVEVYTYVLKNNPPLTHENTCETIESKKVCPDEYKNLSEAEARSKAESDGVPIRVRERDGKGLPVTADFNPHRINLSVDQGKVTSAIFD